MERFAVEKVIEILKERPVTSLCAPPTFVRALLLDSNFAPPFKALQTTSSGGEVVSAQLIQRWKERTGSELCKNEILLSFY